MRDDTQQEASDVQSTTSASIAGVEDPSNQQHLQTKRKLQQLPQDLPIMMIKGQQATTPCWTPVAMSNAIPIQLNTSTTRTCRGWRERKDGMVLIADVVVAMVLVEDVLMLLLMIEKCWFRNPSN